MIPLTIASVYLMLITNKISANSQQIKKLGLRINLAFLNSHFRLYCFNANAKSPSVADPLFSTNGIVI